MELSDADFEGIAENLCMGFDFNSPVVVSFKLDLARRPQSAMAY